jgi:hypothetical protein
VKNFLLVSIGLALFCGSFSAKAENYVCDFSKESQNILRSLMPNSPLDRYPLDRFIVHYEFEGPLPPVLTQELKVKMRVTNQVRGTSVDLGQMTFRLVNEPGRLAGFEVGQNGVSGMSIFNVIEMIDGRLVSSSNIFYIPGIAVTREERGFHLLCARQ